MTLFETFGVGDGGGGGGRSSRSSRSRWGPTDPQSETAAHNTLETKLLTRGLNPRGKGREVLELRRAAPPASFLAVAHPLLIKPLPDPDDLRLREGTLPFCTASFQHQLRRTRVARHSAVGQWSSRLFAALLAYIASVLPSKRDADVSPIRPTDESGNSL